MKIITPATNFTLAAALASAFLLQAFTLFAGDAEEKIEQQFPYVIPFELGRSSGFYGEDQIAITSVRGDRENIEPGGSYLVEGSYTLDTANSTQLTFYCTTREPSGPGPVQNNQRVNITKGTGRFYLYETNLPDGYLHVSFSSLHGNIYFGEKGNEKTILRDDRVRHHANRALMEYLGNPVPAPPNMDARYTSKGLSNAVQSAALKAGITLKKLEINDEEFPFLVGVICGGSDAGKLKAEIKKMDGYEYGGGVGDDSHSDGSDTCNTFCIVPYQAYPKESWQQIQHRRMLREEVFYEKLHAEE